MLETTPARVAGPRAAAGADEPIPDLDIGWTPNDLPRAIRSRRTYRIPVILLALLLAAGAYAGFRTALELPAAWADGRRSDYHAALQQAEAALPGLRNAAAVVSDAGADPRAVLVDLLRADSAAAGLEAAAESALPPDLPLLPDIDRDLLMPLQDRMRSIADRLAGLAGRLDAVAAYRNAYERMFVLPDLPDEDEGPTVDLMAERLSGALTATVSASGEMPEVDLLSDHRAEVDGLIAWYPEWQASYLHALRDGDLRAAGELRAEAEARIAALDEGLARPLAEIAAGAANDLTLLERDLEVTMLLTG